MAPHSSTLAWKIPWTEETGGLQSNVSQRVRHNWADKHNCVRLLTKFMRRLENKQPDKKPQTTPKIWPSEDITATRGLAYVLSHVTEQSWHRSLLPPATILLHLLLHSELVVCPPCFCTSLDLYLKSVMETSDWLKLGHVFMCGCKES